METSTDEGKMSDIQVEKYLLNNTEFILEHLKKHGTPTLIKKIADIKPSTPRKLPLFNSGPRNSITTSMFRRYVEGNMSRIRQEKKNMDELKKMSESELFTELIKDIATELDVNVLCHKILQNVNVLTKSDRSSLFLVRGNKGNRYLVSKLFDVTETSTLKDSLHTEDTEIKVPFGVGIAGNVAETKDTVNIKEAYEDPRFNKDVDKKTGYKTKSILCMPIVNNEGEVIGVAQIINKTTGNMFFTADDEALFEKYLTFCGIGLTNAQLFEMSVMEYKRNQFEKNFVFGHHPVSQNISIQGCLKLMSSVDKELSELKSRRKNNDKDTRSKSPQNLQNKESSGESKTEEEMKILANYKGPFPPGYCFPFLGRGKKRCLNTRCPFKHRVPSGNMKELRPRKPKEINPEPKKSLTAAERAQRYRDCLRKDPAKWQEHLIKERERKKNERRNRTEEQKQIDTEKSRLRQREYKKRQKEKGIEPKKTESKVLTRSQREEQRAYWRDRQKVCRSKKSSQKKRRTREHDRNYRRDVRTKDISTQADDNDDSMMTYSKEALRKSASRTKCHLPGHAEKFAETINYIVEKATPRKKEALKRKGLICSPKKKKENLCREKMVEYFKDRMKANKSTKRKYLAAMKVMKKYNLSRTTSLLLNVQPSTLSRCREEEVVRATRSDALSSDVKKKLDTFFNQPSVSTTIPDKKAVLKDGKEKKILDKPLVDCYKEFKSDNPDVEIAFSTFSATRPSNISTSKKQQWYSCLCEMCTNVDLKLKSINAFAAKVKKPEMKIRDRYEAVHLTLCSKGEKQFHQLKCIDRECGSCQTDLFMAHLQPLLQDFGHQTVEYTRWDTTKMRNKHGKEVSKVIMVKHRKSLQDMVLEIMAELSKLSKHLFNARWQQLQFSTIIKDIPENRVILNLDFAENYSCVSQMEIQTAHWYHQQVTIHPIVAYYKCQQCQETVQESILFISDDLVHDAHAVHKFVSMTNKHLQETRMINIQLEIQFSDGCSSQYKSFTPLCDISYALEDYGFPIERHFYGSRHGKGPCDGAGAVLKSAARRAVMGQTQVINTSKDLYEFAKLKLVKDDLPNSDEHLHSKRTFFHVTENEICRNRPDRIAKTLKGTRLLHSIKTKEAMNIFTRTLSCFCQPCCTGIGQCQNFEYVENWKEEHLYRQGENRPRVRQNGHIGVERGHMRNVGRQRGVARGNRGQNAKRGVRNGTRIRTRGGQVNERGGRNGTRIQTRGGQANERGGRNGTRIRTRGGQANERGDRNGTRIRTRGGQANERGGQVGTRGQIFTRKVRHRGGHVGTREQVDNRRGQVGRRVRMRGGQVRGVEVGTTDRTQGQRGKKRRRQRLSSDSSEVSEIVDCSFELSDSEQEDSDADSIRSVDVSSLGIEIPSFDDGEDQGYSIDLTNIIYSLTESELPVVELNDLIPDQDELIRSDGGSCRSDTVQLPVVELNALPGQDEPFSCQSDIVVSPAVELNDLPDQDKNTMLIDTTIQTTTKDGGSCPSDTAELPVVEFNDLPGEDEPTIRDVVSCQSDTTELPVVEFNDLPDQDEPTSWQSDTTELPVVELNDLPDKDKNTMLIDTTIQTTTKDGGSCRSDTAELPVVEFNDLPGEDEPTIRDVVSCQSDTTELPVVEFNDLLDQDEPTSWQSDTTELPVVELNDLPDKDKNTMLIDTTTKDGESCRSDTTELPVVELNALPDQDEPTSCQSDIAVSPAVELNDLPDQDKNTMFKVGSHVAVRNGTEILPAVVELYHCCVKGITECYTMGDAVRAFEIYNSLLSLKVALTPRDTLSQLLKVAENNWSVMSALSLLDELNQQDMITFDVCEMLICIRGHNPEEYSQYLWKLFEIIMKSQTIKLTPDSISVLLRSFSNLDDYTYLWHVIVHAKQCKMSIVPDYLLYKVLAESLANPDVYYNYLQMWVQLCELEKLQQLNQQHLKDLINLFHSRRQTNCEKKLEEAAGNAKMQQMFGDSYSSAVISQQESVVVLNDTVKTTDNYKALYHKIQNCYHTKNWKLMGETFVELCLQGDLNNSYYIDTYAQVFLANLKKPAQLEKAFSQFIINVSKQYQEESQEDVLAKFDGRSLAYIGNRLLYACEEKKWWTEGYNMMNMMIKYSVPFYRYSEADKPLSCVTAINICLHVNDSNTAYNIHQHVVWDKQLITSLPELKWEITVLHELFEKLLVVKPRDALKVLGSCLDIIDLNQELNDHFDFIEDLNKLIITALDFGDLHAGCWAFKLHANAHVSQDLDRRTLRALLTACGENNYLLEAKELFKICKSKSSYPAQIIESPRTLHLTTAMTSIEIKLEVESYLEWVYRYLCDIQRDGVILDKNDFLLRVHVERISDPTAYKMPYLCRVPRTEAAAYNMVMKLFKDEFSMDGKLVFDNNASFIYILTDHVKKYLEILDANGLRQGFRVRGFNRT